MKTYNVETQWGTQQIEMTSKGEHNYDTTAFEHISQFKQPMVISRKYRPVDTTYNIVAVIDRHYMDLNNYLVDCHKAHFVRLFKCYESEHLLNQEHIEKAIRMVAMSQRQQKRNRLGRAVKKVLFLSDRNASK